MMRHLFRDVNDPYPLCLLVGVPFQQLSRSSAKAETGHLSIDIGFHRFGGCRRRALGGTPERHVTECAPTALDAVRFHTYAGSGRGSCRVGDVQVLKWWFSRVGGVRDGDYIPMGPEMFPENRIIGFADLPALAVEMGYWWQPHGIKGLRLQ